MGSKVAVVKSITMARQLVWAAVESGVWLPSMGVTLQRR